MTSSSEIDSIFKQLCKLILPTSKPEKITQYYPIILGKYPKFKEIEIELPSYGISFRPWEEWTDNERPKWWSGYNKIKHERELNFESANLKNTLYSVGALYSLLLYLGVEKSINNKEFMLHAGFTPKIFDTIDDRNQLERCGTYTNYYLPDF